MWQAHLQHHQAGRRPQGPHGRHSRRDREGRIKIVGIKKIGLTKEQAEGFYYVHAARPFFGELTTFMSSGTIVPMVLEKENAIADLRTLMGERIVEG